MKLVIKQHRPLRRMAIGAGIVAATLLLATLVLDFGDWRALVGALVSSGHPQTLSEEVSRLRDENSSLRYDVARLKRGEEIDKSARTDNQVQFMRLQAEVASLKRELSFYRDVIGGSDADVGVQVKGIQLKALESSGRFSYRLILAHIDENDSETEGAVRIAVKGDLKGQNKAFGQGEVIEAGSDSLAFKFKHFRMFEGILKLPEGFIPRQISVAVQSRIPQASASSQTYDWAAVQN